MPQYLQSRENGKNRKRQRCERMDGHRKKSVWDSIIEERRRACFPVRSKKETAKRERGRTFNEECGEILEECDRHREGERGREWLSRSRGNEASRRGGTKEGTSERFENGTKKWKLRERRERMKNKRKEREKKENAIKTQKKRHRERQ